MSSFNTVTIMGNITRDPEIRTIPSGQSVCDITLAVNDKYKDKETVAFIDVVFWGKQAETLAQYKKKGDSLLVQGKLVQEKWVDKKSGDNRSKLKVTALNMTFVGGKPQGDSGGGNSGGYGQAAKNREQKSQGYAQGGYDDYATDLPNPHDDPHSEPPFI